MPTRLRLLLVDDHGLFRRGLLHLVEENWRGIDVEHCNNRNELEALLSAGKDCGFDLIVLDLNMLGYFGLESLQFVKRVSPDVPVVVVSGEERPGISEGCLHAGAAGFVQKAAPAAAIIEALSPWLGKGKPSGGGRDHQGDDAVVVSAGQSCTKVSHRITERQLSVLQLLAQGKTNKMIARALGVSDGTVKTHIDHLMSRFSVNTRTELVFEATRQGIRFDAQSR